MIKAIKNYLWNRKYLEIEYNSEGLQFKGIVHKKRCDSFSTYIDISHVYKNRLVDCVPQVRNGEQRISNIFDDWLREENITIIKGNKKGIRRL